MILMTANQRQAAVILLLGKLTRRKRNKSVQVVVMEK